MSRVERGGGGGLLTSVESLARAQLIFYLSLSVSLLLSLSLSLLLLLLIRSLSLSFSLFLLLLLLLLPVGLNFRRESRKGVIMFTHIITIGTFIFAFSFAPKKEKKSNKKKEGKKTNTAAAARGLEGVRGSVGLVTTQRKQVIRVRERGARRAHNT